MFRQFLKTLVPCRNRLTRAVNGDVSSGVGASQPNLDSKEDRLTTVLKRNLPGITFVSVEDISGGCGAMFQISVEAKEFIGLSTVKQHRLVTDSLKKEIAEMHGIRIHTTASQKES